MRDHDSLRAGELLRLSEGEPRHMAFPYYCEDVHTYAIEPGAIAMYIKTVHYSYDDWQDPHSVELSTLKRTRRGNYFSCDVILLGEKVLQIQSNLMKPIKDGTPV